MKKQLLLLALINSFLMGSEIIVDKTTKFFSVGMTRDNTKKTVLDKQTWLIWQDNATAKSVKRNWQGAKDYCQNLVFAGQSDWRLPDISELKTIMDTSRYKPANKTEFQNIASSYYWSSSHAVISTSVYFYAVDFNFVDSLFSENDSNFVRCVRTGQSDILSFQKAGGFEKLVSLLTEQELQSIPKPPSEMKLIKGEFETSRDFEVRVAQTKESQKIAVAQYKKAYAFQKQSAQENAVKKALEIMWGKPKLINLKYDADNGYFVADIGFEAKKDFNKKVAIKIDSSNAKSFKDGFAQLAPQAVFDYEGGSVKLKEIRVPYAGQDYLALFTNIKPKDTQVAVNIKNDYQVDTNLNTNITVANDDIGHLDTSKLSNFGELDTLLKDSQAVKQDSKKWLFVVGIEKYKFTDNISYAQRSAEMFTKTAQKKLGVPKENSFVLINEHATQAEIKTNMKKLIARVKSGDTVYFYYNGHGVPVPTLKNEPFMLTSDSEPDYVADEAFFSLQNIYSTLSNSNASKVVAFVDSCFSGVTDGKSVLKGVAATKMVAKSVEFNKDKMVVLTAGKGNQYSNGYDKKGYRLFSFFVMKNILAGETNIKTLFTDSKTQTYDTSMKEYGDLRVQEPTVDGNSKMSL